MRDRQPWQVEDHPTLSCPIRRQPDHLGVLPWEPDLLELVPVAAEQQLRLVASATAWTW